MPKIPPLIPDTGYDPVMIDNLLTTPLDEEQLRLIGEITTRWNSVQSRFQYFIWYVADWVDGIGPLVTADLSTVSLVTLARNIADNRIKNGFARECASVTADLFDALRISRNKVVHGLPVVGLDGTVQEFSDLSAKKGAGLKVTIRQVGRAELSTLVDNMALLAVAVEGIILQSITLRHWGDSLAPYLLLENLERSMLLPISAVRECLDSLRPQPPDKDKPQPPPQS